MSINEEKQSPEEINFRAELEDIMFAIKEKYIPVASIREADLCLSTVDFIERITQHYPLAAMLDSSEMYKLLKDNGYSYSAIGDDAKLQWLVKLA
ncbi:MAG: hypothetical protein A3F72_02990 [Bacteroidetes bacterium RIFCSPLOWO2_12_FULL_35_15]|nr:MAG: hypothetical protein A3F72_02990 [Bacteroidetes bacterium RIFCSPLOWO2_12_FULL_35_15]